MRLPGVRTQAREAGCDATGSQGAECEEVGSEEAGSEDAGERCRRYEVTVGNRAYAFSDQRIIII